MRPVVVRSSPTFIVRLIINTQKDQQVDSSEFDGEQGDDLDVDSDSQVR